MTMPSHSACTSSESANALFDMASIMHKIREKHNLDEVDFIRKTAFNCGISEQTVRNLLSGRSVNARVLVSIIDAYDITRDEEILRSLLLAFLKIQLPEDRRETLFVESGFQ